MFVCLSVAVCTGKQIQGFLRVKSTHAREQGVEMLKLTPDKLALESEATTPKHCAGGNCLGWDACGYGMIQSLPLGSLPLYGKVVRSRYPQWLGGAYPALPCPERACSGCPCVPLLTHAVPVSKARASQIAPRELYVHPALLYWDKTAATRLSSPLPPTAVRRGWQGFSSPWNSQMSSALNEHDPSRPRLEVYRPQSSCAWHFNMIDLNPEGFEPALPDMD